MAFPSLNKPLQNSSTLRKTMSSAVATPPPAGRLALIRKINMRDRKLKRLADNFTVVDSRYTNPTEDPNECHHDVAEEFEAMMKSPTAMNPLAN